MRALLRYRDFALLWLASFVSFAGDSAFNIALPLHVYELTGSTLSTAAALAASILPRVLFGSVAGTFVDRWDRKHTMIAADLLRAATLLVIVAAPDRLAVLYAVGVL